MWEPDPSWALVRRGRGALTIGVWRAESPDGARIVKRIRRPGFDDPDELERRTHPSYWRREAEVALAELPLEGIVSPRPLRVDEDDEGITLWSEEVTGEPPNALAVARTLARLARSPLPDLPWLARSGPRSRLARSEERGGWPTLARTTVADLADVLWRRRHHWLDAVEAVTSVAAHGDLVPGNLLAVRGDDVVAVDWGSVGWAPAGADLGYYALSCKEDFEVVLDAHLAGLREAGVAVDPTEVTLAARVTAVFTVMAQAEWALARVAGGEGALAGKFRHPAVAPYLRALQRQLPQVEALLDG